MSALSLATVYFLGSGAAGLLALRSRDNPGPAAADLTGLGICVAEWSFFYGMEVLSQSPEYRILWSQLAYVGTYGSVAFMTRFCVRWLKPGMAGWWLPLLWFMPVFMVVAAFTNGLHGLVWPEISAAPGFPFVYRYDHGVLFWVGIAYQYLLVVVCVVLVLVGVIRRHGIYRQQAVLVLTGLLIAVAGNAAYVSGALGAFPVDITPLTLAVTTGFLLAGVSRARLLELLPAARHRVVDVMPDGLMVLDEKMRIVDWNPAVIRLWNVGDPEIRGRDVREVVPGWRESVPATPPNSFNVSVDQSGEASIRRHIDVELRRFAGSGARPKGWIVLFHDSTELRAAELRLQEANARLESLNAELARQAVHDGLTGLFNRSYLDEALPRELARAQRDDLSIGLLILDIDHFKSVNDRCGHDVGDQVLARVAELVRTQVRAGDIPCRYGGDEIVAVMPGASHEEALRIGERIRESVSSRPFGQADAQTRVSVSVGVAVYPDHAASAPELFRRADRALYLAKDKGRDRVEGAHRG